MAAGRSAMALAAAALLGGCADGRLAVSLPDPADARSLILGLRYGGELEVRALDLEGTIELPIRDPFAGPADIYVVFDRRPLGELGVPAGRLVPAPTPGRARRLPPGDHRYQSHAEGERIDPWVELPALPEPLATFVYDGGEDLCPPFTGVVLPLPPQPDRLFALALPDGSYLTGAAYAPLLEHVWPSGQVEVLPIEERFAAQGGYLGPDGVIWLGSATGALAHGTVEAGFTRTSSLPEASAARWLAGPTREAPFELFVLSLGGGLWRYDGTGWELLYRSMQSEPTNDGGLVWLGPGEVMALPPQPLGPDNLVIHYRRDAEPGLRVELLPVAVSGGAPISLALSRQGPVLVTKLNSVLALEDGEFRPLPGAPAAGTPRLIAAYGDGFIYAGRGVDVVRYAPRVGFCPPETHQTRFDPHAMAVGAGELFMVGRGPDGGLSEALILRP